MVRPSSLRLEASSVCQLRCPTCPTASGEIHKVIGKGFLQAADFRRLLEANADTLRHVELSNFGEPFLNPNLLDIMRIAAEFGVELTMINGANLNSVRDEVLEGLVKYGVRAIHCSLDGASDAIYAIYRRRGDFSRVISNIRKINDLKCKYGVVYPQLSWNFVVFGHNEHELPQARRMAAELGMTFCPKLSWDSDLSPVRDAEMVKHETGFAAATRETLLDKKIIYLDFICNELWDKPQVNFDGRVLGCCINRWQEYGGNAFESLDAALNSETMAYARAMVEGKAEPRDNIPCVHCRIYKARVSFNQWVERD
jgi:MoaA/NifB/PqqE/SkfB family radical SAM enzyme